MHKIACEMNSKNRLLLHSSIIPVLTQIGVVLGLGFIVKQRSGYGFDYMLLAIMRGYDPRTLVSPMLSS